MYAALENRATALSAGVFIAIVILGKMFGGKLLGLIPLGMCIASGIFLWMKEVLRQGRSLEWTSEKERGKMVCCHILRHVNHPQLRLDFVGNSKLDSRVGRMDQYIHGHNVGPD